MVALEALSNPVRRQILEMLAERPLKVVEIANELPVSRPAVSRHLRVLGDAGLVASRAEGAANYYELRHEGFDELREYLSRFWDDGLRRFKLVAENIEDDA